MKKKYIFLIAGVVTFSVFAAQSVLYLENGKRYIGEITDVNEENITIKTKDATLTYSWKRVKLRSIKKFYPALYEKIKKEKVVAMEIKKKKLGLVAYVKNDKIKWVTPKKKIFLENKDKGMEIFEGEWKMTNEIAEIEFSRKMKAKGQEKYKGKWYTKEKLEEIKEAEANKGLKTGMKEKEVLKLWGEPTRKQKSADFQTARKREMWVYENEEEETEDRVIFENGSVRKIMVDQEFSE